jgi:hypothetical protein
MARVFVLRPLWLPVQLIEALARILRGLGFDLDIVTVSEVEPELPDLASDDILLVFVDPALDRDQHACLAIKAVSSGGACVVGVWPPTPRGAALPSVLQKHVSGGLVTCETAALKALLNGGVGEIWLESDGRNRPKQDLPRGGC